MIAPNEMIKSWEKIFVAYEKGTLMTPNKQKRTNLDDHLEAQHKLQARHEKKKSSSPFEEKPYVCKPFTKEAFKNLVGLTHVDHYLAARRFLDVKEWEEVLRVTIGSTKNPIDMKSCSLAYVPYVVSYSIESLYCPIVSS